MEKRYVVWAQDAWYNEFVKVVQAETLEHAQDIVEFESGVQVLEVRESELA
jgi:hypothetical protein